MADKLTRFMLDALTRAAADPGGLPLFAGKAEPGLFPASSAAKPAAQRCLDAGLLRVVRTDNAGRTSRELCAATPAGVQFLIDTASPKDVLEDFVRVLESRQDQAAELVAAAARMADGLAGLRAAVNQVLPQVSGARMPCREPEIPPAVNRLGPPPATIVEAIRTLLADFAAGAPGGQDCPLPELFRALTTRTPPPTVGGFHDALRQMHADRRVYLHPWTGPLYSLPEPEYALLVGHEIAYYASPRTDA